MGTLEQQIEQTILTLRDRGVSDQKIAAVLRTRTIDGTLRYEGSRNFCADVDEALTRYCFSQDIRCKIVETRRGGIFSHTEHVAFIHGTAFQLVDAERLMHRTMRAYQPLIASVAA